ncbi:hypothetical protein GUY40_14735 [Pseudomonas sp. R5(2019)]|nr:hypothetical protein [Pseudomonas sp. R5(2019)]
MNTTRSAAYNYKVVRQYAIVGMELGVFLAAQLVWPRASLATECRTPSKVVLQPCQCPTKLLAKPLQAVFRWHCLRARPAGSGRCKDGSGRFMPLHGSCRCSRGAERLVIGLEILNKNAKDLYKRLCTIAAA